jgi:hypothetical protein
MEGVMFNDTEVQFNKYSMFNIHRTMYGCRSGSTIKSVLGNRIGGHQEIRCSSGYVAGVLTGIHRGAR